MKGLRATRKQKCKLFILPYFERLIYFLVCVYVRWCYNGEYEHSCWAGGFDPEAGIVRQQCDVCEKFIVARAQISKMRVRAESEYNRWRDNERKKKFNFRGGK